MFWLVISCVGCSSENTKQEQSVNNSQHDQLEEHTHDYVETIVEATCVNEGKKTYTCSICSDTYTETIAVIEHSYEETEFKNATCTNEGKKTYTCSICGDTYSDTLTKTEHSWSNATCTTAQTCSLCGLINGSALGHQYSNGVCANCGASDPITVEVNKGKTAYIDLSLVEGYCDIFSDAIYDAWYFAIYNADDYWTASIFSAFGSKVGIEVDLVIEGCNAFCEYIGAPAEDDLDRIVVLGMNSGALFVVHYAFEKEGYFAAAKECLDDAKKQIQSMDKSYTSYNAFSELSSYYSAASSYFDFCYSPSGSFSQLSATLNGFRNSCATYRNACSLYFD